VPLQQRSRPYLSAFAVIYSNGKPINNEVIPHDQIQVESGRRGFAVYRDGMVVAHYTAIRRRLRFGGFGDTEKCGYIYALTVFLFLEK
jgi:hypothetical protein